MTSVSAAMSLALLTIANFFIGKRRMLYPPFIYSFIWCIDCAIFSLSLIPIDEVHPITWAVILVGALFFSVGGWLTLALPRIAVEARIRQFSYPRCSRVGIAVMLLACCLGLPLMLIEVIRNSGGGSFGETLVNARLAFVAIADAGKSESFIVSNLPIFSIAVALLSLIEGRDKFFWSALMFALCSCVLTGGRSYVLLLFCSVIATEILIKRRDDVRSVLRIVAIPLLCFVTLFVALIFLDKDLSGYEGNANAILGNFLLAYIVVPIPALDHVLTHPIDYAHAAHHTLGFLLKALSAVGIPANYSLMHDSYVFVPLPTNVYTIYKFYFTDFGMLGALGAILAIGFLQTAIYKRSLFGCRLSIFLSALLIYPTVLSIFDDLYSGGGLLQLLKASLVAIVYFAFLCRLSLSISFPRFRFLKFSHATDQ